MPKPLSLRKVQSISHSVILFLSVCLSVSLSLSLTHPHPHTHTHTHTHTQRKYVYAVSLFPHQSRQQSKLARNVCNGTEERTNKNQEKTKNKTKQKLSKSITRVNHRSKNTPHSQLKVHAATAKLRALLLRHLPDWKNVPLIYTS